MVSSNLSSYMTVIRAKRMDYLLDNFTRLSEDETETPYQLMKSPVNFFRDFFFDGAIKFKANSTLNFTHKQQVEILITLTQLQLII